jgi:beta-phosphoglucomutase-like phosphatase (HAD superfamily)
VAIEDSVRRLRAAMAARSACVVIHSAFTASQDFSGAWRLLPSMRALPAILADAQAAQDTR